MSASPPERGRTGCRLAALIHLPCVGESLVPPNGTVKQRPRSFHSSKYHMPEKLKDQLRRTLILKRYFRQAI